MAFFNFTKFTWCCGSQTRRSTRYNKEEKKGKEQEWRDATCEREISLRERKVSEAEDRIAEEEELTRRELFLKEREHALEIRRMTNEQMRNVAMEGCLRRQEVLIQQREHALEERGTLRRGWRMLGHKRACEQLYIPAYTTFTPAQPPSTVSAHASESGAPPPSYPRSTTSIQQDT